MFVTKHYTQPRIKTDCLAQPKHRKMERMGEDRKVSRVFVGKPEGKRPLGRPRRRWEIGLGGVEWIKLAQDRDRWWAVVSAVMNLRVLAPRSYPLRIVLCRRSTLHVALKGKTA
jgi:hypothetical protein